jgi:hypothetical protein
VGFWQAATAGLMAAGAALLALCVYVFRRSASEA